MERVTISLDEALLAQFDAYLHGKGYANRSEAVRDLLRERLESDRLEQNNARYCIACLSYVYNHHEREMARRLAQAQHDHHDLTLSTVHVHLDHDHCLEVTLLRGETGPIRHFAETIMAERGIRHGNLHLVPTDLHVTRHDGGKHGAEPHVHSHPHT